MTGRQDFYTHSKSCLHVERCPKQCHACMCQSYNNVLTSMSVSYCRGQHLFHATHRTGTKVAFHCTLGAYISIQHEQKLTGQWQQIGSRWKKHTIGTSTTANSDICIWTICSVVEETAQTWAMTKKGWHRHTGVQSVYWKTSKQGRLSITFREKEMVFTHRNMPWWHSNNSQKD